MRKPLKLAAVLVSGAHLAQSYPSFAEAQPGQVLPPQSLAAQAGAMAPQTPCRTITAPVGGNQPQRTVGEACQQPDGSVQITLHAPGLPRQIYTMQLPQSLPPEPLQPLPSPLPQDEPLPQPLPVPEATDAPPTYIYPYAYYAPPPVFWSNPWTFDGFPFFVGSAVHPVHNHFFFRHRLGRPVFFRDRVIFRDRVFFKNNVLFKDRATDFRVSHPRFDGRGFHGSGSRMSGSFGGRR